MKSFIVGLTGQSGAGKTTVCKAFQSNGFHIINADMVSRFVTQENKDCIKKLRFVFSDYFENGVLNRRRLGSFVFSDKGELRKLTSITYPYIIEEINKRIEKIGGDEIVLIDAPTLFESGLDKSCDRIISVVADEKLRLERIIKRDDISKAEAEKRFSSQLSENFFKKHSDYLIKNNSDKNSLISNANQTAKEIKEIYYGKKET